MVNALIDPKKREEVLKALNRGELAVALATKKNAHQAAAPEVAKTALNAGDRKEDDFRRINRNLKFIRASEMGERDEVERLLKAGADVDAKDESERTALNYAARRGHREVVEFLIQNGADVNAKDDGRSTPLIDAAAEGRKEIVELLIGNGADVHWSCNIGASALYFAIEKGHEELVRTLIDAGADVNAEGAFGAGNIVTAIWHDHINIAKILLNAGADAGSDANSMDHEGMTPLEYALRHKDFELAELLKAHGAKE